MHICKPPPRAMTQAQCEILFSFLTEKWQPHTDGMSISYSEFPSSFAHLDTLKKGTDCFLDF